MRNTRSKNTRLTALVFAGLITMIGLTMPQRAVAQTATSQLPPVPPVDANQLVAPANDMFANAEALIGTVGSVNGTNVDATLEVGEPSLNPAIKTVWYKWTATANLSMSFETLAGGTLTNTALAVYTGTAVDNLTYVNSSHDINFFTNRLTRITFIANAGTTYYFQVRGESTETGTFILDRRINEAESGKQFNFDGANGGVTSDYAVFRPSNGYWYIRSSNNGSLLAQPWGVSTDTFYPGDFDADGSTDIGVWRQSDATFYVLQSGDGTLMAVQWGLPDDVPVQGDFDGDDMADITVFRPSNGTFYIRRTISGGLLSHRFGQSGDILACGDYDGDGITDVGVQRSVNGSGVFYYRKSSTTQTIIRHFGLGGDLVVPGDYDGDGKNDIAVYRNSNNTLYALRSSDGGLLTYKWGIAGDVITPGNYVGDIKSDVTVFRPSTGSFYSLDATANSLTVMKWGMIGDDPVAHSNVH